MRGGGRDRERRDALSTVNVSDPVGAALTDFSSFRAISHPPGNWERPRPLRVDVRVWGLLAERRSRTARAPSRASTMPTDWPSEKHELSTPSADGLEASCPIRQNDSGTRWLADTLRGMRPSSPGAWNLKREAVRQGVNEWLRQSDAFDAIVDFDRALCDPDHSSQMRTIRSSTRRAWRRLTWDHISAQPLSVGQKGCLAMRSGGRSRAWRRAR